MRFTQISSGTRASMTLAMIGAAVGQDLAATLFNSSATSTVQRTVKILLPPAITIFCTDASRAFPTGEPGAAARRKMSKNASVRGTLIFILPGDIRRAGALDIYEQPICQQSEQ
jgi:hypothetical protein